MKKLIVLLMFVSSICFGTDAIFNGTTNVNIGNGNVGIGTTNPVTKLYMSSGTLTIDGNATNSIIVNGNVGIGTTAPGYKLDVSGDIRAGSFIGAAMYYNGVIFLQNNSDVRSVNLANSAFMPMLASVFTPTSARRFKTDIVDTTYGLSDVLNLEPRKYTLLSDNKKHIGLIAEEVETVVPEVVVYDKGQIMGINYMELVPILVNAIKELEARIKVLEKK